MPFRAYEPSSFFDVGEVAPRIWLFRIQPGPILWSGVFRFIPSGPDVGWLREIP